MEGHDFERSKDYACLIVLGAQGSGKTSLVDQYVRSAAAAKRRVRVLDPQRQFPAGYIPGVVGEYPGADGCEVWIEERMKRGDLRGGLLVCDDADIYMGSHLSKGSPWLDLIVSNRHYEVDIVINSRRTQEVPKVFLSSCSHMAVFRTRGTRARAHIREHLEEAGGPELMEKIPRDPYRYLMVDCDHGKAATFSTKARPITVNADSKKGGA